MTSFFPNTPTKWTEYMRVRYDHSASTLDRMTYWIVVNQAFVQINRILHDIESRHAFKYIEIRLKILFSTDWKLRFIWKLRSKIKTLLRIKLARIFQNVTRTLKYTNFLECRLGFKSWLLLKFQLLMKYIIHKNFKKWRVLVSHKLLLANIYHQKDRT